MPVSDNVVQIFGNKPEKERAPKIVTYLHCALCLEELPAGESIQDYAMSEVGFTKEGIQIWCRRHNANVVHLDFEGRLVPAIAG